MVAEADKKRRAVNLNYTLTNEDNYILSPGLIRAINQTWPDCSPLFSFMLTKSRLLPSIFRKGISARINSFHEQILNTLRAEQLAPRSVSYTVESNMVNNILSKRRNFIYQTTHDGSAGQSVKSVFVVSWLYTNTKKSPENPWGKALIMDVFIASDEPKSLLHILKPILRKFYKPKPIVKKNPQISIIVSTPHGGWTTVNRNLGNFPSIPNEKINLYYPGLPHESIVDKINTSNHGIILLHGIPGSGKTTYIKNLIAKFEDTRFVFLPVSLSKDFDSPQMSAFIVNSLEDKILIIEDAERLLISRNESSSSNLSGLLNVSDGIVSCMIRRPIILTFNTNLSNIDSAVLRKGRLLVEHEFRAFTNEQARLLCEDAGVTYDRSMTTVADIFCDSITSNKKTIEELSL